MGYHGQKGQIDYKVIDRVNKLFGILEKRFYPDKKIWLSHVAFLERLGWKDAVDRTYSKMLQKHPLDVEVWVRASRFLWRQHGQRWEMARERLLTGLRMNKGSEEELLREYFWFELNYWTAKRNEGKKDEDEGDKDDEEPILRGEVVRSVFREAVKKVDSAEFACSLLKVATGFDVCHHKTSNPEQFSVNEIREHIRETHSGCALAWDCLANSELPRDLNNLDEDRLTRFMAVHAEGDSSLDADSRRQLADWRCRSALELLRQLADGKNQTRTKLRRLLDERLREACLRGELGDDHARLWVSQKMLNKAIDNETSCSWTRQINRTSCAPCVDFPPECESETALPAIEETLSLGLTPQDVAC